MTAQSFRAEIFDRWKKLGALTLMEPAPGSGLLASAFFPPTRIDEVAADLWQLGCLLENITAFEAKEGLVVTYHFDAFPSGRAGRLAPRVLLPHDDLSVLSISKYFQGALWHERESFDFYGINFVGHPNLIPILLPDYLEGPPPLKKNPEKLATLAGLNLCVKNETPDAALWPHVLVKPAETQAAPSEETQP